MKKFFIIILFFISHNSYPMVPPPDAVSGMRSIEKREKKHENYLQISAKYPWYREIVDILKEEHEKSRKGYFKIPKIGDAVWTLIDLYNQNQVQCLPLLQQAVKELDSELTYNRILDLINSAEIYGEKRGDFLPLLNEWVLRTQPQEEDTNNSVFESGLIPACIEGCRAYNKLAVLRRVYNSYLSDKIRSLKRKVAPANEQSHKRLFEIFPHYYAVDPQSAIIKLQFLIEREIKWSSGMKCGPELYIDNNLFKFLEYLQFFNAQKFENTVQEILSKHFEYVLKVALKKPGIMKPFEGSSLSLSNLINKAFNDALREDDGCFALRRAFETFLKEGHALHAQYQERIISMIPLFIQAHPYSYEPIIQLVKSPVKDIRSAAFKMLTEHCTSRDSCVGNWCSKNALGELFALNLNDIIGDGSIIDAYRCFYEICKQNKSIFGMQLLWLQLAQGGAREERTLLVESMHEFFGVQMSNDDMQQPFEAILNNALQQAMQTNSVSSSGLIEFFMQANETEIAKIINPHIHENFKMSGLVQDDMPIKIRCAFLSDLLYMRCAENKSYSDVVEAIERLVDSEFKEYARTIIEILNPNQTYYEYFSKRRKLNKFCENNKDFDDHPGVINSLPVQYNAFRSTSFQRKLDVPKIHQSLDETFITPQLSEGLLIGYVHNQFVQRKENAYCLYACDVDDGYAVWRAPFTVNERQQFVVSDSAVYCVIDDDKIGILNRNNGCGGKVITTAADEKISSIAVTANDILFIIHKTKLCIFDGVQEISKIVALPKRVLDDTWVVGEKMVFGHYSEDRVADLILVDKDGKQQTVSLGLTADLQYPFLADIDICGNEKMIFCTVKDLNGQHILCLNYDTGQKIWKYVPSEEIKDFCYAKKTNKLFLLTEHKLIALDTLASDDKRVLWRTPILRGASFSEIDGIKLSNDEAMIYGIQSDLDGDLFCFNSQNGDKTHLYAVKEKKAHRLIGACNGKVYVQPYAY